MCDTVMVTILFCNMHYLTIFMQVPAISMDFFIIRPQFCAFFFSVGLVAGFDIFSQFLAVFMALLHIFAQISLVLRYVALFILDILGVLLNVVCVGWNNECERN